MGLYKIIRYTYPLSIDETGSPTSVVCLTSIATRQNEY